MFISYVHNFFANSNEDFLSVCITIIKKTKVPKNVRINFEFCLQLKNFAKQKALFERSLILSYICCLHRPMSRIGR